MIPAAYISAWSHTAPWPSEEQIEQDLVLSRLIIEIAKHPALRDELVFRGGTALHKIVLDSPLRYSEDLDYVRTTHGPIGPVLDALREVSTSLGMDMDTEVRRYPKVRLHAPFESGVGQMRVKVEINTHETSPARPYRRVPYIVESPWWSGGAEVLTFQREELIATKLRALFQRKKGRDLFDLWIALTELDLDPDAIIACFRPYVPAGYTADRARQGLDSHLGDEGFRRDLEPLVRTTPGEYQIEDAASLIRTQLLDRL